MEGKSTKTRVIGIRPSIAQADAWEAEAKKRGITTAALVLDYAMRGDPRWRPSAQTGRPTDFPKAVAPFFKQASKAALEKLGGSKS